MSVDIYRVIHKAPAGALASTQFVGEAPAMFQVTTLVRLDQLDDAAPQP